MVPPCRHLGSLLFCGHLVLGHWQERGLGKESGGLEVASGVLQWGPSLFCAWTCESFSVIHFTHQVGSSSEPVSPQGLSGPESEGPLLRTPTKISAGNQSSRLCVHSSGGGPIFGFCWPRSSLWRSKKQKTCPRTRAPCPRCPTRAEELSCWRGLAGP